MLNHTFTRGLLAQVGPLHASAGFICPCIYLVTGSAVTLPASVPRLVWHSKHKVQDMFFTVLPGWWLCRTCCQGVVLRLLPQTSLAGVNLALDASRESDAQHKKQSDVSHNTLDSLSNQAVPHSPPQSDPAIPIPSGPTELSDVLHISPVELIVTLAFPMQGVSQRGHHVQQSLVNLVCVSIPRNRPSRNLSSNKPSVAIEYIQLHVDSHVRGTDIAVNKASFFDDREAYLERCVY